MLTAGLVDDRSMVHDDAGAIRVAIGKLLAKSSPLSLKAVKARQKELAARLKRFGKTTDPDEIWKSLGVKDVAAASLASGPEFVAMANAGRK